jgi:pimeloyl-ACP methyl ester carboxylesterase
MGVDFHQSKNRTFHFMKLQCLFLVFLVSIVYAQLEWVPCNLYTDVFTPAPMNDTRHKRTTKFKKTGLRMDDDPILTAECSYMNQPLLGADARRIFVHAKRLTNDGSTGILILVGGGLAVSSSIMDDTMNRFYNNLDNRFDIYSIEPRGVGRSERLGCERSQAETLGSERGFLISDYEVGPCGDDVNFRYPKNGTSGFSYTAAAQDILDLITAERKGRDVFLYGFSFGTYLVNRVLVMNNGAIPIRGIALDSIVPFSSASNEKFVAYDRDVSLNAGVINLLNECKVDAYCGDEMMVTAPSGEIWKQDVAVYAQAVFTKAFVNATCSGVMEYGYNQTFWKVYMAGLSSHPMGRLVVPAILYRLDRCDSYDVGVLTYIGSIINSQQTADPLGLNSTSPILERLLSFSEFWTDSPPSFDDLEARFQSMLFGIGAHSIIQGSETFPRYPPDQYYGKVFSTNAPVLLLSGNLDTFSPPMWADLVETQIQSPNKQRIKMPWAPHWVIQNSPVYGNQGGEKNLTETDCGFQILVSFLYNPAGPLDRSCLTNLKDIDWRGTAESNLNYMGVEDLFNGIYEPYVQSKTIDLYLFITIYTATCIIAIIVIALLTYYIFQLCARVKDVEESEDEFVEQE